MASAVDSTKRAILTARVGAARVGASRVGYCPVDTDTKTAGATGDRDFYVHHERVDDARAFPTHTVVAP